MPEQDFQARFETLMRFIDDAIEDTGKDVLVSMDHLEREVDTLCRDISRSNPSIANAMKPVMADAIDRLDILAQALSDFQQRMKNPESASDKKKRPV